MNPITESAATVRPSLLSKSHELGVFLTTFFENARGNANRMMAVTAHTQHWGGSRKLILSLITTVALVASLFGSAGTAQAKTVNDLMAEAVAYELNYTKSAKDVAELFDAQNAARAKAGVPKIRFAPAMSTRNSQPWADYMAETYWWGETSLSEFFRGQYRITKEAENIALIEGDSYLEALTFWAGPTHERYMEQLLDPDWKIMGIGVARNSRTGVGFVVVDYYAGPNMGDVGVTYATGQEYLNAIASGVVAFPLTPEKPKPVTPAKPKPANPAKPSTVDVYSTPGNHTVNGRKWRTTCEKYSDTITRCRAEIFATQTHVVNGKYVTKNAFVFNNLTYLPSQRAQWTGNNLAKSGYFTSQGRDWNTSCNDSWTGAQGCRSFIKSVVIESSLNSRGQRVFKASEKWVFNNVVRFSN